MQIPISFDLPEHPVTELLVLRSQINREFSRFSRTISRGQMHIERTDEGEIRCSIELRTKRGEKVSAAEETASLRQAFKIVIKRVQQKLRDFEEDEVERKSIFRQSGGIFQQ